MTATRRFHLGDVLTLTTGVMVSPRRMAGVRDVIHFMCGGEVYTNQLGDALNVCKPALLTQHPALADVEGPGDGAITDADTARRWVDGVAARRYPPARSTGGATAKPPRTWPTGSAPGTCTSPTRPTRVPPARSPTWSR